MALADTARLIASLDLQGNFDARIRASEKALGSFDTKLDRTQSRAYRAGQQIGTGIQRGAVLAAGAIGFLAANVGLGLKSLTELETVTTQTNAVLKSTKGVAGETADSIRKLAEKYEGLNATIDDKVIQSAENVLLTFTAIRKDAFEPTLRAALDLSTAMGQDLQTSVVQVGKALQDPIRGITALRRVGVNFSDAQVKVIKSLVETGHAAEAQRLILKELNTEFGGSFLAGGTTTAGKVAKFKDSIEDLQKALAQALLPTIGKVADKLSAFLADPATVKGISQLGEKIAGLFSDKNLTAGANFLKGAFETFKAAAPFLEQAAKATLGFIQAAVGVFKSLPAPLQGLLAGGFALNKLTGGLVTNIAGGIADLIGKSRGATPATPVFVSDVSGGLGGAAGAAGGAGLLGKLGGLITKLGGLALVLGGVTALGAGVQAGGPAGAGIGALGAGATIGGAALLAGPIGAMVASLGVVGKTLLDIRDNSAKQGADIASSINTQISGGAKLADLKQSLAAVNTGINDIQANPLNVLLAGDALDQLKAQRDLLQKQILESQRNTTAVVNAATGFTTGLQKFTPGKEKDDIVNLAQLQKSSLAFLRDQFRQMLAGINKASSPAQIAAAIKAIEKNVFERGKGGVGGAKDVIAGLKGLLLRTDDPKSRAAISGEIRRMEHQLNYRTLVAAQLRKADQIFKSNEGTKRKIDELKGVQRSLSARDLAAQHAVQAKIDALKRADVYAQRATTQAIKDKDLSVKNTINVKTVVPVSVNARAVGTAVASFAKYFFSASAGSGGKFAI